MMRSWCRFLDHLLLDVWSGGERSKVVATRRRVDELLVEAERLRRSAQRQAAELLVEAERLRRSAQLQAAERAARRSAEAFRLRGKLEEEGLLLAQAEAFRRMRLDMRRSS